MLLSDVAASRSCEIAVSVEREHQGVGIGLASNGSQIDAVIPVSPPSDRSLFEVALFNGSCRRFHEMGHRLGGWHTKAIDKNGRQSRSRAVLSLRPGR